MAHNMRLSKADAKALDQIVSGRTVKMSNGAFGTVYRLTRGGIQVRFSIAGKPRSYQLYESISKGDITLVDPILQGKIVGALNQLTSSVGLGKAILEKIDDSASEKRERQGKYGYEADQSTEENLVANNAKMLCGLKGISLDVFQKYMVGFGIDGFEESITAGFAGNQPYLALKETAHYLGFSADELLASPNSFLELLFKACSPTNRWARGRVDESLSGDGFLERQISFKNASGTIEVVIRAFFMVKQGSRDACNRIVYVLENRSQPVKSKSRTEYLVPNPTNSNVQRFNLAYKRAASGAKRENAVSDAKMSAAAQSGKRGVAKTLGSTSALDKLVTQEPAKPIHVNEFLVRKAYGMHRQNGHRLDSIKATVCILPMAGGEPRPVEFDAYWCPKCRKYFMTEGTSLRLKRQGYICCKVVEEKDLGTKKVGDGVYGKLASESILHMYGYTVNRQDDLTERERQTIVSFVIENRIQSAQEIAHLLGWLISQREGNLRMAVAVSKWKADPSFVRHYHKPTRTVRVDKIYAKL